MSQQRVEPHDVRGLARLLSEGDAAFRAVEAETLTELGLRPWMLRALDHLARVGSRSPSVVAKELGVTQPTVSGWILELTARGLIERVPEETDGRRATLRLTTAGSELRTLAADRVRRRQLRLASSIDPVSQGELVAILERLIRAAAAARAEG